MPLRRKERLADVSSLVVIWPSLRRLLNLLVFIKNEKGDLAHRAVPYICIDQERDAKSAGYSDSFVVTVKGGKAFALCLSLYAPTSLLFMVCSERAVTVTYSCSTRGQNVTDHTNRATVRDSGNKSTE